MPALECFNIFRSANDEMYIYYLILLVTIILGYFFYKYFNSENFLEEVERTLIEVKENVAFYTNKMLLQSNMEGDAIKTTQVNSFI